MSKSISLKPLTLLRIGWGFFAALCFSRAITYSSLFGPAHDSVGPLLLTDDGQNLWWFALLWALIGVALSVEVITGRVAGSMMFMGALMVVWGGTYIADWISDYGHSPSLITACYYSLAGVGLVFVCLAASKLLHDNKYLKSENERLRVSQAVTGSIKNSDEG